MKKIIIVLFFVQLNCLFCQAETIKAMISKSVFKELSDSFTVMTSTYTFNKLDIEIVQAKKGKTSETTKEADNVRCGRALLNVKRDDNIVDQKYYHDFEPFGGNYGLFVPPHQPSKTFFLVIKYGDYDGRLLIINSLGRIEDSPGGNYFITQDKNYLISDYDSDNNGLTVVNLKTGHVEFSTNISDSQYQWYLKDNKYYFTISEWLPQNGGNPSERNNIIYYLDLNGKAVHKKHSSRDFIKSLIRINYSFDVRKKY